MSESEIRIVPLATAPNEAIAEMWREMLRDEGIVILVKSGASGFGLGHNLLNEQYLFVRADQFEQARQILDDIEDDESAFFPETS